MRPPGPAERTWTHPSEVGLATRGVSDRRRSTIVATGIVLGGLGLLLSGVVLGSSTQRLEGVTADSEPIDRIERSIATVVAVHDGASSVVTGVVIDAEGHVLVPAGEVSGADALWARCDGSPLVRAEALGAHPEDGIAVLRLPRPAGTPVTASATSPRAGMDVVVAGAATDSVTTRAAEIGPGLRLVGGPLDLSVRQVVDVDRTAEGHLVFDPGGHLLGMTVASADAPGAAPVLHPAIELMVAARSLIAAG